MIRSPSRRRLDVASSGHASTIAPTRNAPIAQSNGTRNAGTKNIENPVAIPSGGITIFLSVIAVRPSRTRHASTPHRPISETTAVIKGVECNQQTSWGITRRDRPVTPGSHISLTPRANQAFQPRLTVHSLLLPRPRIRGAPSLRRLCFCRKGGRAQMPF